MVEFNYRPHSGGLHIKEHIMATILAGTVFEVTTAHFNWAGSTGTAEASELGLRPGYWPENLYIVSTTTQTRLLFWRHTQDVDAEGDLLSVTYITATCGRMVTVVVYND